MTPRRLLWSRELLSTLAFAVPTSLLAIGWLFASMREDAARVDRAQRDRAAEAHAVSAAVSEGLEELRAREDERPYALYTYYYAPPGLLSLGESLALSPLGAVPTDPRVLGHFQLDPGAVVRSPLAHEEASASARARGLLVIAAVHTSFANGLAPLTRATPPPRPNEASDSVVWNQVQNLEGYNQRVLTDLREAEAGKPGAEVRAATNKVPARRRVDLASEPTTWSVAPSAAPDPARSSAGGPAVRAPHPDGSLDAAYSRMVFRRQGEQAILYRTVTTDGAASVQGALLDLPALRATWLPAVARRHTPPGTEISFVPANASARCLATAPLASPLDDRIVCAFGPPRAATGAFGWQVLALGGVLALIGGASAARLRAARRTEELARTERAFVASVSHELRTPLTTFRLHAEMLQEGLVSEARKPRVLAQLVEESQRLARLIEDVLTFGRLADGQAQLSCRDADLAAHVRGVIERERPRLLAKGAQIDLQAERAVQASFDAGAVEQMLTNLLDNALKYGRVGDQAHIRIVVALVGERTTLLVTDGGPGVPAAERERVFDRFYRSPQAQASHVAGTGLGLAIVRGLARAMGGEARLVEPPGGKGCAVEITFRNASPAAEGHRAVLAKAVFFLSAPSDDEIRSLLGTLADAPCTHRDVGLTQGVLDAAPRGYRLDRYGTDLGEGRAVFERASAALSRFENYPRSFTRIVRRAGELAPGHVFATVASHLGFVSVHPCRVLYVIREPTRFGFGFGTLPGHAESGEERFVVELVGSMARYEVLAFSKPTGFLPRLGAPIARGYQLRFQRETLETMRRLRPRLGTSRPTDVATSSPLRRERQTQRRVGKASRPKPLDAAAQAPTARPTNHV